MNAGQAIGPPASVPATAAFTQADAETAVESLGDLADAWKHQDCAKVGHLTTWVENTLGGRVCEAARSARSTASGRAVPDTSWGSGVGRYRDPEFLVPGTAATDDEDGAWFAVLARRPEPAYFVFVRSEGRWRLGAGPIPLIGPAPKRADEVGNVDDEPDVAVRAKLVPTRYVTFLTDPAGVSGVKFASGDPMRGLLTELVRAPGRVRPDRLSVDVRIEGSPRALALPDGSALVFHALRLVHAQEPGPGRSTLAHPRYAAGDVRAFTGKSGPRSITAEELVLVATKVSKNNRLTTVALRRTLADIAQSKPM
ncbi:hypothetical protein [Sphaerimonospora thailandensis]|uniref:hypothetical protein n=1 Tax=Sphaerimonospora thailandensis TaxID=795644 RepID=UPI0019504872|nr:hypothetical protein [Sphaerimonospora thailandensis]